MKVEMKTWEVTCNHRYGFNRLQVNAVTSRSAVAMAKKEWSSFPNGHCPTSRPDARISVTSL